MDIFINIIVMVLAVTEYVLFGRIFFLKPFNKKISGKLIGILFVSTIIVLSGFLESPDRMVLLQIISTFVAIYCILDITVFEAVKIWLIAFPMLMLIEIIPYVFYKSEYLKTKHIDVISISVIIALMLLYFFLTKKKYSDEAFFLKGKIWLFASVELFILLFLIMSFATPMLKEPDGNSIRLGILIISILCIIILNFLMIRNYNAKNTYKLENKYLDEFNKQQHDYFGLLLSKEEETRTFRHDINNELIELKELLRKKRYDDVDRFISEMGTEIMTIKDKAYSVGNETVDTMLNYYLLPVKDKAKIQVRGILGEDINMSQRELCIAVSNLVKNAVEEIVKGEEEKENERSDSNREKYIKIFAARGKSNASLRVENSLYHQLKEVYLGIPQTTKNDKKDHGYGLKNVKRVVEQNEGIFNIEASNDFFAAEIILKTEKYNR